MFDWLTPFSLLTGVGAGRGYALLGATWLIMKTEGPLQDRCFTLARRLLLAVLVFVGIVSIWTPLIDPHIAARWFSWPNLAYLSPVPIVTAAIALVALALARSSAPRGAAVPADDGPVPARRSSASGSACGRT